MLLFFNHKEVAHDHFLNKNRPTFSKIKQYEKLWCVKIKDLTTNIESEYYAPYVSIATGHHGTPSYPDFPGMNTFKGDMIHVFLLRISLSNVLLHHFFI